MPSPLGVFATVARMPYHMPCEKLTHIPQELVKGKLLEPQLAKKGQTFPAILECPLGSWDRASKDAQVLS